MSPEFRTILVLMTLGAYAYGSHVTDSTAFAARVRKLLR